MSIASLEDLCIFNSLGSEYLSQSLSLTAKAAEALPSDPLPAIANIHPCSRLLTKDLIDKIKPLQRYFQRSMESQAYFIDISQLLSPKGEGLSCSSNHRSVGQAVFTGLR